MWYNTVPTVSAGSWLVQVVDLFNHTLSAVMGQPVLAALACVAVFMLSFGLLAWLLRKGRKGRL